MKRAQTWPTRVRWDAGVHIVGTGFWCDSWRAREICFVSSAHAVAVSRHGQLLATKPTLTLLDRGDAKHKPHSQLPVPFGKPFTLGTTRIELVSSGHCIGGASLCLDIDGERVVYAGTINPAGSIVGGPLDPRGCDSLIVNAYYGQREFDLLSTNEGTSRVAEFASAVMKKGGLPVLLVSSPCKAVDLAAALVRLCPEAEIRLHRSIHQATQKLFLPTIAVPNLRRWNPAVVPKKSLLIWPIDKRDALDMSSLPEHSKIALVSGRAVERAFVENLLVDIAIPWSNQAGYDQLIEYIEASGARRIYLTDRYARPLAAVLGSPKRQVVPMAPPQQMNLF